MQYKTVRVESHHSHQRVRGGKVRAEVRLVTGRRKWPFYQPHSVDTHTAVCRESHKLLLMCGSIKKGRERRPTCQSATISSPRCGPDLVSNAHTHTQHPFTSPGHQLPGRAVQTLSPFHRNPIITTAQIVYSVELIQPRLCIVG